MYITRHIKLFISILLFLSLSICVCAGESSKNDSAETILFVGNSLTFTNDLPALVEKLGKEKGLKIKTQMLAYPNYALEDHWNEGKLHELLKMKTFDFVVVQQGPSSQVDGSAMLRDYGLKIKALCDSNHAQLAYFMVWPSMSYLNTFDGVIKNYTDAAQQTSALLCPVGKVWKDYFLQTNDYSYYGPDLFHPSLKGSLVAAQIIFETLFK